jgi:Recombination endonuclease VII
MPCSNCGAEKVLARGLCQGCYTRLRRTGSLERTYVRNAGLCSVEGCGKSAFAKNLCAHHYAKAEHPLKATWRLLRSRHPDQYPAEWDRFDVFLEAVGERPSPKHQLRRVDGEAPWSVGNVQWLAPVISDYGDYYTPEQRSSYAREWHLQRKFKLTGEEYATLLGKQGGGCAVCGQKETHRYKSGKLKDLSVDHDHTTGAIRGLLCFNCNQGIGRLQDSPALLRKAAEYLEK